MQREPKKRSAEKKEKNLSEEDREKVKTVRQRQRKERQTVEGVGDAFINPSVNLGSRDLLRTFRES